MRDKSTEAAPHANQSPVGQVDETGIGDDISLAELLLLLWRARIKIAAFTTALTVCAIIYALMLPRIYRAEAVFTPPGESDVEALNVLTDLGITARATGTEVEPITTDDMFSRFSRHLQSWTLRKTLFEEENLNNLLASGDDAPRNPTKAFEDFNDALRYSPPDEKKSENIYSAKTMILSLEGEDPEIIASIVNSFAERANNQAVSNAIVDVHAAMNARIDKLRNRVARSRETASLQRNDEIAALEEEDRIRRGELQSAIDALVANAEKRRKDRIEKLKEAAIIAEELGIVDRSAMILGTSQAGPKDQLEMPGIPADTAKEAPDKVHTGASPANALQESPDIIAELNVAEPPLYLKGKKALLAEARALQARESDTAFIPGLRDIEEQLHLLRTNPRVEQLKARKNDDPFIKGLREMQQTLSLLEGVTIDANSIRSATFDQTAYPPTLPVRPHRRNIVIFGFLLGVVLSSAASLLHDMLRDHPEQTR